MLFWIICIVLALVVGAMIVAPLLRKTASVGDQPDVAFYRAQLAELDRDVARGVIDAAEAEQSRVEVSRRLLAADKQAPQDAVAAPAPILAAVIVAIVAAVGLLSYASLGAPGYGDLPLKARLAASDEMRSTRPSQAAMVAAALPPLPVDAPDDYLASVAQLRDLVPTRGDDAQGWELLAYHEAQLRNYDAAAMAQTRLIEIKGDAVTPADSRRLVDLLVAAADGLVSPEAEVHIRALLDVDPTDPVARFYLGTLYNQTDRPDVAFRLWGPIVAEGDPQAFHTIAARSQIEDAAFRAGIKYTLPPERGPTAEDIANAADLSAEDRDGMIRSMVAGLADRLATSGGPASDWARLISAYGVLGETAAATEVWLEAQEVFAGSQSAMDRLRQAATDAGVAE